MIFKHTMRLALLSLVVLSTTACRKKKTVVVADMPVVHVQQRVSGVVADTTIEWTEADLK